MAQVVRAEQEAGLLNVDIGEPVVVIYAQLNLRAAHLAGSVGQAVRAGLVLLVDRNHVAVRIALCDALRVVLVPVVGVVLVHLLHHLGGVDQGIEQLDTGLALIVQRRLILGRGQVDVDILFDKKLEFGNNSRYKRKFSIKEQYLGINTHGRPAPGCTGAGRTVQPLNA